MTRTDGIVIAVVAALALLFWPMAAAATGGASRVTITGPAGETVVSLSEDSVYEIDGARGAVTVTVEDGAVSVTESDCPDHTCIRTSPVRAPGSVIACVPNRVIVRVGGDRSDGLDARVR